MKSFWLQFMAFAALGAAGEALNTQKLAFDIGAPDRPAQALEKLEEVYEILKRRAGLKELVVLMSTGDFGGLFQRLAEGFSVNGN